MAHFLWLWNMFYGHITCSMAIEHVAATAFGRSVFSIAIRSNYVIKNETPSIQKLMFLKSLYTSHAKCLFFHRVGFSLSSSSAPSIYRTINRLINVSIDQSIYRLIDQSISRSFTMLIYRSINLLIHPSISRSIYRYRDQSINQSIYRSIDLLIYRLINLSIYRSINISNKPYDGSGIH